MDELNQIKNPAETMHDVMATLGEHTEIKIPEGHDLTKPHLVTIPHRRDIQDLTPQHRAALEYLKPARRKGTARLSDLQSLVDWSNRFKGETSALFANPDLKNPTLTAIADYHAAGAADPLAAMGDPSARHCHHRAIYDFPLSEEWKAWTKVSSGSQNGGPILMDKDDLGEFIEANAKDVMDPTPGIIKGSPSDKLQPWENRLIETAQKIEGRYGQLSQLLTMSRTFAVHETSNMTLVSNRDTGESQIQFVNEHKAPDGSPLSVPNLIIITIPVFTGGAPYRMAVRFRYRKTGGVIRFMLQLYTPEKVFEAAIKEAVDMAKEETKLPVFMGQPET